MSPRILVVQHEADDPAHLMGEWMAGAELVPCLAYEGDEVPADLASYDGLVVMGGVMGANDDATSPWLTATKELIRRAAADQVPVLGICLGHQLAAVALGGEVTRNPRGRQFGLLPVGWCDEAADDPLLGATAGSGVPATAVQWNDDIVTRLPEGARLLAVAATGEVQAARHAPSVWGVQWHPEVDEKLVRSWAADGELDPDLAEPALAAIGDAAADLERAWRPLALRFAELAAAGR